MKHIKIQSKIMLIAWRHVYFVKV